MGSKALQRCIHETTYCTVNESIYCSISICFPRLGDDECGDDKRGDDRRGDDRRGDAWGTLGANTAWSTQTFGAYLLPLRAL